MARPVLPRRPDDPPDLRSIALFAEQAAQPFATLVSSLQIVEMAQVDYLLPAASHVPAAGEEYLNSLHSCYISPPAVGVSIAHKHGPPEDDATGAASLPTPPPEVLESGEFPSSRPLVAIPGLPHLSADAPGDLIRSMILQANFEVEMGEASAQKAFFVADLGRVYRQFSRWRHYLPDVEPFYGE